MSIAIIFCFAITVSKRIMNKNIIELNNIVINEIIEKIYIYSDTTIKIKFKYEMSVFTCFLSFGQKTQ